MDHQRLLLDHLDLIDQIVRTNARRRHLSGVEQEDFASFVRVRLIEDDYAVLRKFQNRSSLWTYLSAVIERLSYDFSVAAWGRWRPSVMAQKLGPIGERLEQLVSRNGHSLEEAIEIMRTNHSVPASPAALRAMWEQLPVRGDVTEVGEEAASAELSPDASDADIEREQRRRDIARIDEVLKAAFKALAKQDRVILALRFDEELSLAQIAQVTRSSITTMHRRIARNLEHLRRAVLDAGFDPSEIAGLIGHPSIALSPLLRAEIEKFPRSVRLSKRDG